MLLCMTLTAPSSPTFSPALLGASPMSADGMPSPREREAVGLALRAARKSAGISTQQGAEAAGISVPMLGSIERGAHSLTSVSSGSMGRMHRAFGLTWPEFLAIVTPAYGEFLPHLRSQHSSEISRPVDYELRPSPMRKLVYGGMVGAGINPRAHSSEYMETLSIPDFPAIENYDDQDLMVLTVSGDSMVCEDARLTIPEGSTAIFHTSLAPQPGDVVAAWLAEQGVGVLKVYRPDVQQHVILESYNKRHLPIILTEDNPGEIQGVYVGHIASGRRAHNRKPPVTTKN